MPERIGKASEFDSRWYVLSVRGNAEHRAIGEIKRYASSLRLPYRVDPFVLESERYYRSKDKQRQGNRYQRRPLFPGYIFVETDMPEEAFLQAFYEFIAESSSVIRLLPTGGKHRFAVSDEERTRLEYWCLGRRCLTHSEGYIEGDAVRILSGPLVGMEGSIKKINRHNCCAEIEVVFLSRKQTIKVALEIIAKS